MPNFQPPPPQNNGNDFPVPQIHEKFAAAAISDTEALFHHKGETFAVPFDEIDADKVELKCFDDGCALVVNDKNPNNDLHVCDDESCPVDADF